MYERLRNSHLISAPPRGAWSVISSVYKRSIVHQNRGRGVVRSESERGRIPVMTVSSVVKFERAEETRAVHLAKGTVECGMHNVRKRAEY